MTVETETSRSGPYAGAGTTGPFTVGFRFLADSHLQVIKTDSDDVDTTLTLTTDYTVAGAGDATGTVTLLVALAVGEQLTIIRDVPFTQQADYVDNDSFPAESHEQALDLLTMQTQQVKESTDRALTLPATVSGVSTELPAPVANNIIGWDSAGTALENVPVASLATSIIGNTYSVETFDGDGAETEFTLISSPGGTNPVFCSVGGVDQIPGIDFTVSGTTLTFLTGAPPVGTDNIAVKYGTAVTTVGEASSVTGQTSIGTALITAASEAVARSAIDAAAVGAIGASGLTMATARMLGRTTASTGAVEEITVGSGLSLAAGALSATYAPPDSSIQLNTSNGYGSSSTTIRRFANIAEQRGSYATDFTVVMNGTVGTEITINTADYYTFAYCESVSASQYFGLSINSAQLTVQLLNINLANRLIGGVCDNSAGGGFCGGRFYIPAGSVIRPHTNAVGGGTAAFCQLRISRG